MCTAEDFVPAEPTFQWKKGANSVTGFTTWGPKQIKGVYSAVSVLNVQKQDWDDNSVYTCEVWTNGQMKKERKATKGTGFSSHSIILLYCNSVIC